MTLFTRNHVDRTRRTNPPHDPPGRPPAWQEHQTSCDEAVERGHRGRLGAQPDKAGPALVADPKGKSRGCS